MCFNGRIYIGMALDVEQRFRHHVAGRGALFTRINKPYCIMAAKEFPSRKDAAREDRAKASGTTWFASGAAQISTTARALWKPSPLMTRHYYSRTRSTSSRRKRRRSFRISQTSYLLGNCHAAHVVVKSHRRIHSPIWNGGNAPRSFRHSTKGDTSFWKAWKRGKSALRNSSSARDACPCN